ncbi:hypothetical protein BDY24DRAFT_413499 [Mrakia frigida]|uniref:uncharacterized protein n=1 Tax=Mrakia frigida TaxID=29902 RepID=UPI003FCC1319
MALLPNLPIEIKANILRFCDQATLAKTSGLSLAFLELSSPLLRQDIHVVGLEGLRRLLCERDGQAQPHLSPHLDLPLVSRLTFVWDVYDKDDETQYDLRPFSFDRLSSSSQILQPAQILVEDLAILLPLSAFVNNSFDLASLILPVFSPTSVRISSNFLTTPLESFVPLLDLGTTPWSRLRILTLDGVGCLGRLSQSQFFERTSLESVTVVLDLSSGKEGSSTLSDMVYEVVENEMAGGRWGVLSASNLNLKELVVKVPTKLLEAKIRSRVEGSSTWQKLGSESQNAPKPVSNHSSSIPTTQHHHLLLLFIRHTPLSRSPSNRNSLKGNEEEARWRRENDDEGSNQEEVERKTTAYLGAAGGGEEAGAFKSGDLMRKRI